MAALQPSKSDPLGSAGGRALIRVAGWQLWVPRDSGLGWGISRRECSGGFVYFPKLLRRPEKQSPELPLAPPWSPPFPLRLPGTGVWAGPGCPFPFLQGFITISYPSPTPDILPLSSDHSQKPPLSPSIRTADQMTISFITL